MALTLNVIELITADMAASLAFYRRLGLAIPAGSETETHVEIELDGGMKLSWDTAELIVQINPRYQPPAGGVRIALAFQCADPAEVDRTYTELTEAGAQSEMEPFDAFWGHRYAVVRDPDGNGVDLYAPQS